MSKIEAGDIVQFKGKGWLTVLEIRGDRALCSFQVTDKPLAGHLLPEYLTRHEDLFPVSDLEVIRKGKSHII